MNKNVMQLWLILLCVRDLVVVRLRFACSDNIAVCCYSVAVKLQFGCAEAACALVTIRLR